MSTDIDNEKAQAIERANSYRVMLESWAFKDFMKFVEETRMSALESAVNSDEIKDIQKWRGYVQCIDSINGHIGFVLGEAS